MIDLISSVGVDGLSRSTPLDLDLDLDLAPALALGVVGTVASSPVAFLVLALALALALMTADSVTSPPPVVSLVPDLDLDRDLPLEAVGSAASLFLMEPRVVSQAQALDLALAAAGSTRGLDQGRRLSTRGFTYSSSLFHSGFFSKKAPFWGWRYIDNVHI